ncbi:MAG: hypothetical protein ACI4Q6_05440 [Huintestinicola sp.]
MTDYDFYSSRYGGKLSEEKIMPCIRFAEAFINSKTDFLFEKNGYPEEGSSLYERVQLCACEAGEEKYKMGLSDGKSSEAVGNYSVSYAEVNSEDVAKRLMPILETYIPDVIKTVNWI